ncbi:MAG: hypothetical protein A2538_03415, partial [Candidatus Magasanikbacteria bacterium RIFOXYD2_FULL_41_14]
MLKIFSASSHPQFAQKICENLGTELSRSESFVFSNDNRFVTIEEPVRGDDVFVIQTSCEPVDAHIVELLMYIRTLRDASAGRITAVMPYFPYVRSDKKDQPRVCISARLMADLLEKAGANRVLMMEMHSQQIQGFFSVPCDHLLSAPSIISYLTKNWDLNNYALVAGDAGAAKLLKIYADGLNLPVAIMDKRRESNDEKPTIKGVVGDVRGKKVLIVDDEMSSGRTLIKDTEYLLNHAGAVSVDACITHAVLGAGSIETLNNSQINRFVITDTIPTDKKNLKNKEVVSVTSLFAECIRRTHENQSIRSLNQ